MDKAFKWMNALMVGKYLFTYPNYNKIFHIYTDTFNYQIGAYIDLDIDL